MKNNIILYSLQDGFGQTCVYILGDPQVAMALLAEPLPHLHHEVGDRNLKQRRLVIPIVPQVKAAYDSYDSYSYSYY